MAFTLLQFELQLGHWLNEKNIVLHWQKNILSKHLRLAVFKVFLFFICFAMKKCHLFRNGRHFCPTMRFSSKTRPTWGMHVLNSRRFNNTIWKHNKKLALSITTIVFTTFAYAQYRYAECRGVISYSFT